jgi:type VI secretion system secreted protein Hcp
MALTSYLTLEGQSSGSIEGDCTQSGREKTILVYGVNHSVTIPRDDFTGQPTGQVQHKPLIITKKYDPSSPLLQQMLSTGERTKKWQLDYYQINDKGQEELYYQVQLENAIVVQIDHIKHNVQDPSLKQFHDMEDVYFTYEKITWSHKVANKEASHDWKKPASG